MLAALLLPLFLSAPPGAPLPDDRTIAELERAVVGKDNVARGKALTELVRRGSEGAPVVADAIRHRRHEVRLAATKAAGGLEHEHAAPVVEAMIEALGKDRPLGAVRITDVPMARALSLGMLGLAGDEGLSKKELREREEHTLRNHTHLSLAELGVPAMAGLEQAVTASEVGDTYSELRVTYAQAAVGTGEAGVARVAALLSDERATLRAAGALAIAAMGVPKESGGDDVRPLLDGLAALLDDPDDGVRWRAVEAVAALPPDAERWAARLEASLKGDAERVRVLAAIALRRHGGEPERTGAEFVVATGAKSRFVRVIALRELRHHEPVPPDASDAVMRCLSDRDATVRHAALQAIIAIDPDAKGLEKKVKKLVKDRSPLVATLAKVVARRFD